VHDRAVELIELSEFVEGFREPGVGDLRREYRTSLESGCSLACFDESSPQVALVATPDAPSAV
jgi:hypothetical protein